jgi:hypothetical protein
VEQRCQCVVPERASLRLGGLELGSHGRITSLTGSPEALARAKHLFLDQGRSQLKSQTGLVSLQTFFNAAEGKAAVIATWQDEQSAKAAFAALAGLRQKLGAVGVTVTLQDYELVNNPLVGGRF